MTRPEHLAAIHAHPEGSRPWQRAIVAYVASGTHRTRRRGQPTGLSRGELYHRMLRSHVFDADRREWESRWYASPRAGTFDAMKQALEARKLTEKQAAVAA